MLWRKLAKICWYYNCIDLIWIIFLLRWIPETIKGGLEVCMWLQRCLYRKLRNTHLLGKRDWEKIKDQNTCGKFLESTEEGTWLSMIAFLWSFSLFSPPGINSNKAFNSPLPFQLRVPKERMSLPGQWKNKEGIYSSLPSCSWFLILGW